MKELKYSRNRKEAVGLEQVSEGFTGEICD